MRTAIFSESEADEAAIKILIEGALGVEIEPVPLRMRGRGWPSVLQNLPGIIQQLYYRTDTEALAVVVDSDDSPVHARAHDEVGGEDPACRLCLLRRTVAQVRSRLTEVVGREMLKTALGLAVPAIEAWYRCGLDQHVNETTWARHLRGERVAFTRASLKRDAYGMDRAPLTAMTAVARQAASRLAADLDSFERLFPGGFGAFARDLRSW